MLFGGHAKRVGHGTGQGGRLLQQRERPRHRWHAAPGVKDGTHARMCTSAAVVVWGGNSERTWPAVGAVNGVARGVRSTRWRPRRQAAFSFVFALSRFCLDRLHVRVLAPAKHLDGSGLR